MGLLTWVVAMSELWGRFAPEVLSVFSLDHGARGLTGVHCSS